MFEYHKVYTILRVNRLCEVKKTSMHFGAIIICRCRVTLCLWLTERAVHDRFIMKHILICTAQLLLRRRERSFVRSVCIVIVRESQVMTAHRQRDDHRVLKVAMFHGWRNMKLRVLLTMACGYFSRLNAYRCIQTLQIAITARRQLSDKAAAASKFRLMTMMRIKIRVR